MNYSTLVKLVLIITTVFHRCYNKRITWATLWRI